jgi:glutamate/tyrosine decarboxylase-like PLP-dependent enzyme
MNMNGNEKATSELLEVASDRAIRYLNEIGNRSVAPSTVALKRLSGLGGPVPENPSDPAEVIRGLDEIGSPATMATAGPRFFGFVVGGAMPVTLAANWLAGAWDQNAPVSVLSPIGAECERVALGWIIDLLGLPPGTWGGLVTGATAANFTGLAAARHAVLQRQGWDVVTKGIFGAPRIRVVVGEEVHVSVLLALRALGFGREDLIRVLADSQGRMRVDALPDLDSKTIVCIQAGNVNSGAFDPAQEICMRVREAGAWAHVDGAFGLWAAAAPERRHLTAGTAEADSWALDAHKWLNVPYDCGVAFCREPRFLAAAMSLDQAAYIDDETRDREPHDFTLEMSRRARGVEVWTALRTLGRSGLAELVERTCQHAQVFSQRLANAGFEILNDVVLNQVLVSFGDDEKTRRVLTGVQEEGTCWASGTKWHGRQAMRISVSSWATTSSDVDRSIEAILCVASQETS